MALRVGPRQIDWRERLDLIAPGLAAVGIATFTIISIALGLGAAYLGHRVLARLFAGG